MLPRGEQLIHELLVALAADSIVGVPTGAPEPNALATLRRRMTPLLRTLLRAWGAASDADAVDAAWNELLVELMLRHGARRALDAMAQGTTLDAALRPLARRAAARAAKLQRRGLQRHGNGRVTPPSKAVPIEERAEPSASDPAIAAEWEDVLDRLWELTERETPASSAVARIWLAGTIDGDHISLAGVRRRVLAELRTRSIDPKTVRKHALAFQRVVVAVLRP